MTWKSQISALAVLGLSSYAHARIAENGIWSDDDWYDNTTELGVMNGVPYSDDATVSRRITSPMAVDGDVLNYMDFSNVQRVNTLLPESDFDFVFPMKNDLYTYQGFLRAIAKFPAFCGESGLDGYSLDETCKRELAFLFAHFGQETGYHDPNNAIEEWRQALWHITEWACTPPQWGVGTSSCDYKQSWGWAAEAYPPQPDVQYYGRGPFQLSWNYNYGAFSEVLVESSYNSRMYLLENPDQVHTDSFTVFTSALWFYMTPQSPKPSIHDVAAGFFEPSAADLNGGFVAGFGITTNIINGGQECGAGHENSKSQSRIDYFQEFLDFFELPDEDESTMTCGGMSSGFPEGGFGDAFAYFDTDWSGGNKCAPVKWQTPYSIYTRDDYKRCVCDLTGNGEADCPQADGSNPTPDPTPTPDPDPTPTPDPDPTPTPDPNPNDGDLPILSDPAEQFEEIWENPHYSPDMLSRTNYQVDRSLDYIEEKLTHIHAVFVAHGLIQN